MHLSINLQKKILLKESLGLAGKESPVLCLLEFTAGADSLCYIRD